MSFNNINILEVAHTIFFHPDLSNSIINELSKKHNLAELVRNEIQTTAIEIISESNNHQTQRFLEENMAYLCNMSMLIKKIGNGK